MIPMCPPVIWLMRAQSGRRRERRERPALSLCRRHAARGEPDRGTFDIALAAGDLAREPQPRIGLEPQGAIEQFGRGQKGVAVDPAETGKSGIFQAGNRVENFNLRAMFQLRLKADYIVERAERIVL